MNVVIATTIWLCPTLANNGESSLLICYVYFILVVVQEEKEEINSEVSPLCVFHTGSSSGRRQR